MTSSSRETSGAARRRCDPAIGPMKAAILSDIDDLQSHGLTPAEFAVTRGQLINSVRRRFVELWKDGLIQKTERVRENLQGNPEVVWIPGTDPNRHAGRQRGRRERELERELAWIVGFLDGGAESDGFNAWVERAEALLAGDWPRGKR